VTARWLFKVVLEFGEIEDRPPNCSIVVRRNINKMTIVERKKSLRSMTGRQEVHVTPIVNFVHVVTDTRLIMRRVLLFQFILLKRIPFDSIAEIQTVSFRDMLFRFVTIRPPFTTRLGNRAFGEGVLITRESGVIRQCIISPDHPDEFIRSVTADIAKDRS
jgi:hypothetical protein